MNDILIYAFRYALGRNSHCVDTVVSEILKKWNDLEKYDREQIQKEIREYYNLPRCNLWIKILNKEVE